MRARLQGTAFLAELEKLLERYGHRGPYEYDWSLPRYREDPGGFARMKRGAILVAPATDPSWTPLFTLASGVVVEVGGVLSHASTITCEYGLPALANVKHATRFLRTGERVRLDAVQGLISRLEYPQVSTV